MMHFVSNTSRDYVFKAVCLIQSFLKYNSDACFWIFTMDAESENILHGLKFPNVHVVGLKTFETDKLSATKSSRSIAEYYYTAKPVVLQHVMSAVNSNDWVVWVDTDIMFFESANKFIPFVDASVFITPHRYTKLFAHYEDSVGYFNGGLMGFKKDLTGRAALAWLEEQCLEWCGSVPEKNRYGDQKYLEAFTNLFSGVIEVEQKGVNAAPWNVVERHIYQNSKFIYVEGDPLILFHFQGLRLISGSIVDLYADVNILIPKALRRLVYRPYLLGLQKAIHAVQSVDKDYKYGFEKINCILLLRELRKVLRRKSNLYLLPDISSV